MTFPFDNKLLPALGCCCRGPGGVPLLGLEATAAGKPGPPGPWGIVAREPCAAGRMWPGLTPALGGCSAELGPGLSSDPNTAMPQPHPVPGAAFSAEPGD